MEIIIQVLNNIPINHFSKKLAWNEVLEHIHQGAHTVFQRLRLENKSETYQSVLRLFSVNETAFYKSEFLNQIATILL